ncbi:MAG: hypothetical protein OWQ59_07175 [Alicyclobacillaceae bacterium]|nr:hypothetical protein [Alicyclobacillaceae bacterium]
MKTWTSAWLSLFTVGALLGAAALSAPNALAATGPGTGSTTTTSGPLGSSRTNPAPGSPSPSSPGGSSNSGRSQNTTDGPSTPSKPPGPAGTSGKGSGSKQDGKSSNDNSGSSKSNQSKTGTQGNPTQAPGGVKPLDAPEVPYAAIFPLMAVLAFGIYRWRVRKA